MVQDDLQCVFLCHAHLTQSRLFSVCNPHQLRSEPLTKKRPQPTEMLKKREQIMERMLWSQDINRSSRPVVEVTTLVTTHFHFIFNAFPPFPFSQSYIRGVDWWFQSSQLVSCKIWDSITRSKEKWISVQSFWALSYTDDLIRFQVLSPGDMKY